MNPWIQTWSSIPFDLANPTPDMVRLDDITYALGHINRFTGHVGTYSVAEHSMLVESRVRELGGSVQDCRDALAHDFVEAYTGDISKPMKVLLGDALKEIEQRIWRDAVAPRFDLSPELPAIVKRADVEMLMTEALWLLGPSPKSWSIDTRPLGPQYRPRRMGGDGASVALLSAAKEMGFR
jgi:hypothetical protein